MIKSKIKKGFTLTELIVVIVVIGVLATVLVPGITGYIKKAKLASNFQEAREIKRNIDLSILENEKIIYLNEDDERVEIACTSFEDFFTMDIAKYHLFKTGESLPQGAKARVYKGVGADSGTYYLYYERRGCAVRVNLATAEWSETSIIV